MEIHQHAHSPRKKWQHYIWEFLMLFLAVFCGFLAENQREHMVEHQREKEYMKSLKEDVTADIRQIARLKIELSDFINRLDSIAGDIIQFDKGGPSLITFKQISRSMGFSDFVYTDRTMQQLKNAGGMRMVRNLQVADKIVEYDAMVRRGLIHQDLINNQYIPRLVDKINYAINITEINRLAWIDYSKTDTNSLKKGLLLTHEKLDLIRLINEFRHYRFMIELQLQYIIHDSELASNLQSLLEKEYHLN